MARHLIADGHELRLFVRAASRRDNIADLDAEIAIGDLDDPNTFAPALRAVDGLYHVAADYRLWTRDPAELYRTNVAGTVSLLRAATQAGVQRIVYTSSVAALGLRNDGKPADETTPVVPVEPRRPLQAVEIRSRASRVASWSPRRIVRR